MANCTASEMPAASVAALLAAKPAQLDSWNKTIRNAVRAAKRDSRTYWVGFTHLGFFIAGSPDMGGAYRFECRADGRVFRVGTDD